MEIRYELIFRGFKKNLTESEARKNLGKHFDLPAETIRAMVTKPGDTVESGLTLEDAARLQKAVELAGVICTVEPELSAPPQAAEVKLASQPPSNSKRLKFEDAGEAESSPEPTATAAPEPSTNNGWPRKTWSDPAAHLREALQQNKLRLYCQPILTLQSGRFEMVEVFVRLRDEEDALLPPGDFLPVFEQFRMLPALDRWVVHHIIDFQRKRIPGVRFCINVSGQTLADPTFPGFIADQLKQAGLQASTLVFEIDETDVLQLPYVVEKFASAVRALGCAVLVDGFARAMVSFVPLKTLQIDFVKVDGSIVRNVLRNTDALSTLNSVLRVGEVIDIGVIAECIEEPDILARVKELGVGYGQGYGILVPYPIEELPP